MPSIQRTPQIERVKIANAKHSTLQADGFLFSSDTSVIAMKARENTPCEWLESLEKIGWVYKWCVDSLVDSGKSRFSEFQQIFNLFRNVSLKRGLLDAFLPKNSSEKTPGTDSVRSMESLHWIYWNLHWSQNENRKFQFEASEARLCATCSLTVLMAPLHSEINRWPYASCSSFDSSHCSTWSTWLHGSLQFDVWAPWMLIN